MTGTYTEAVSAVRQPSTARPVTTRPAAVRPTRRRRGWMTAVGYAAVAACIVAAWSVREQNLIHAESGWGYWLGIVGATLMGLLLLYPLRKRVRLLRAIGPVSAWFRLHMLFGIVGPLLIILHSNFRLGSFNGRVALFATLVVAGSGIVGRYIYAKLHHGLYGRKANLQELRQHLESMRHADSQTSELIGELTADLTAYEDRLLGETPGVVGAFARAVSVVPQTARLRWQLGRRARQRIAALAKTSPVIRDHRQRLTANTRRYLARRVAALRKFAQFRAFEKLFSLWHVVHFPLFIILVIAVIVHVLAVHMY